MSLKNTILSVTRRTKKGFTVGEIFDRVTTYFQAKAQTVPAYSTVRARVTELASFGLLTATGVRRDTVTGRPSTTFRRGTSSNGN